jgi:hypothetical protein
MRLAIIGYTVKKYTFEYEALYFVFLWGTLIFLLLVVLVRVSFCTFNVADMYAFLGREQIPDSQKGYLTSDNNFDHPFKLL